MTDGTKKMLTGEFAKRVGLKDHQVKYYCKEGLLTPERTGSESIGNNRRYFTEEDLLRMEQILIFKHLGLSAEQMKETFAADDYDVHSALDDAIDALRKRIRDDQNLLLVARIAQSMGTSLFAFGSWSQADINNYANLIRKTDDYRFQVSTVKRMSPKDREAYVEKLNSIIFAITHLEDTDELDSLDETKLIEKALDLARDFCRALSMKDSYSPSLMPFALSLSFSSDGEFAKTASTLGGSGAAEFCAIVFLLLWVEDSTRTFVPALVRFSEAAPGSHDYQRALSELEALLAEQAKPELLIEIPIAKEKGESLQALTETLIGLMRESYTDPNTIEILSLNPNSLPDPNIYEIALKELMAMQSKRKGE